MSHSSSEESKWESDGGTSQSNSESAISETYNQSQEPIPKNAAFSSEVSVIVKENANMVQDIQNVLKRFSHTSTEIKNMTRTAEALTDHPQPENPLIMLYGSTGSGKTSTINSLIDVPKLLKAVAAGQSCTCVPTMLSSKVPNQSQPFAAVIRFFDSDRCKRFLREQIQNYKLFHFSFDETWSSEERQEIQNLAETATKILQSLFSQQPGFMNPTDIKKFFGSDYQASEEHTLDLLTKRSSRLISDITHNGDFELFLEASSAKRLNERLQRYIYEQETNSNPGVWPLVESVKIGVQNSRILQHVRLLDLPGANDTNTVRAMIANEYIKKCDAMWVVTTITRPICDPPLNFIISTYGERFQGNIAIIATASDTGVCDTLAHEMSARGQDVKDYRSYHEQLKDLAKSIKDLEARRSSAELWREWDSQRLKHQHLQNLQFESLVKARNTHVSTHLRQDKQKYMPEGVRVPVFCISNTHYESFKGTSSGDSRQMSVELTGIPALRKHALSLAAPRWMRNFRDYFDRVEITIRGYQLWADVPAVKRNDVLLEVVNEPRKYIEPLFDSLSARSRAHTKQELINPLSRDIPKSIIKADRVCSELHKWHQNTLKAFFRRGGAYKSSSQSWQNLNEQFIKRQNENVINESWDGMKKYQKKAMEETVERITKKLDELLLRFKNDPSSVSLPVDRFEGMIGAYKRRLEHAQVKHDARLEKNLSNIKLDATRDVATGFFHNAMQSTYAACAGFSGKGCKANMLHELHSHVTSESVEAPFRTALVNLAKALEKTSNHTIRGLKTDVEEIVEEMSEQFGLILRESSDAKKEVLARETIKETLVSVQQRLKFIQTKMHVLKD